VHHGELFKGRTDKDAMSIGYVRLRAFSQATEEEGRVVKAVTFVSGGEGFTRNVVQGHFGNPITIIETRLTKSRGIRVFLKRLSSPGIARTLALELEERMDDDGILHLRLDKQGAYLGRLALATNKDVIDCSMKVTAHPARRDVALSKARECFKELLD
jgi:RNA binding exosome subunit